MRKWLALSVLAIAGILAVVWLYQSQIARSPQVDLPPGELGAVIDEAYGDELVSVELVETQDSIQLDIELAVGLPGRNEPYLILRTLDTQYADRPMRTLEFTGRVAPEAMTDLYTHYIWDSSVGHFEYWEGSGPHPQELPPDVSSAGMGTLGPLIIASDFDANALERVINGTSLTEVVTIDESYPTAREEDNSGR